LRVHARLPTNQTSTCSVKKSKQKQGKRNNASSIKSPRSPWATHLRCSLNTTSKKSNNTVTTPVRNSLALLLLLLLFSPHNQFTVAFNELTCLCSFAARDSVVVPEVLPAGSKRLRFRPSRGVPFRS